MSDGSRYSDRLKLIKLGQLPPEAVPKPKKWMKKISDKKRAEIKASKQSNAGEPESYFDYWMRLAIPKCENCGMEAEWLLQEQHKKLWKACQAHILPKRKTMFPSLANNLDNHLVLFPSAGGKLCGCHGWFDSSWYNASTMDVWVKAVEIFLTKLYPVIPDNEKRHIPEQLIKFL